MCIMGIVLRKLGRLLPFRLIVVVLAALLGFTCLALFLAPTDSAGDSSLRRALSSLSTVKWTPYGREGLKEPPVSSDIIASLNKGSTGLLATLPRDFQEQLTSGLLLECRAGPEGLLRPKYARFLRTLLDYANNHNHVRNSRTLTWQCTVYDYCGGLGDRIRGVAYALLLAIFSRRKLLVFWEAPTEGQYLHPHMVDWTDQEVFQFLRRFRKGIGDRNPPASIFSDPYVFRFYVNMDEAGKLTNDVANSDMAYYQRVIASNESHIVISTNLEPSSLLNPERNGNQEWIEAGLRWSGLLHLSPAELDDIVGIAFRYLFTIDDKVVKEMLLATESLGLGLAPYTALHLRTGFAGMQKQFEELMRHPKLEQNVSKWQSALQCALEVANKHHGHGSPVFLATDSNLVKDIAISKHSSRIHTLRNALVHVDKLKKEPHVPEGTEVEGLLVVWVEFLLLAQADVLVRGESGYSWTAGLLCGLHGNKTVSIEHCTYSDSSSESKAN